jgi:membrane fusion protein, multidrug efflux system
MFKESSAKIARADSSGLPRSPEARVAARNPSVPATVPDAGPVVPLGDGTPLIRDRSAQSRLPEDAQWRRRAKSLILLAAAVAVLGALAYFANYWWMIGRFLVSTDDAYVGANSTTLAAKIPGYVAAVEVEDNARVRAGDVIARIDEGDYQLAVQTARDKLDTQRATIERMGKQILAQEAAVDQSKALLTSAKAGATRAQLELERQQTLATRDFASKQTLETAFANRDQSMAAVKSAEAGVQSAAASVEVLKVQKEEASGTLRELGTALAKAERDLSFAVVRAPFDGVIGNRAVHVGDYVQPGQRLASLVPLDEVYVDANFKETQLARLRPGQKVYFSVDALPGREFEGTVISFAPASGSVFSLLPPDNATGNFTKIVQRVPVRIRVPAEVARSGLLRPGMSVVVSVDTKPGHASNVAPLATR